MKSVRHEKILELIEKYEIETQEELSEKLYLEGYKVTQATISRDIRELKLTKMPDSKGHQKYVTLKEDSAEIYEKYSRVFRDGFSSMDMTQNILVIKTMPGMAMAVAAALDHMRYDEILGCIAGDDTIMCAVRAGVDNEALMRRLRQIVEG